MKKTLCLLLTLCLLISLVPAFAENGPVTVTFWHSMTEEAKELLDGYVADFNTTVGAEKGIRVEAVFQGSYADSVTKMNSILSAPGHTDELPDVMQLDATGKAAYSQAEAAWTVDKMLAEYPETDISSMLPAALMNWNLAGVQLGLPFATSTTVTYYNKTALGGLPVETLQDIAALKEQVSEATADGAAVTIYAAVPNTPTLANWLGQLGSDVVNHRNGSEGIADALDCLDNGALLTFLRAWKDLYLSGALKNASSDREAFAAGRLLVLTNSSSSIAQTQALIGDSFELGVGPYPRVNAEAASGATVSGSCLVMFDHGDARRAAAREFVMYLTSPETQVSFAMGTGYVPSNALAAESAEWQAFVQEHPLYDVALRQILATPASMRSVTVGPSADFYYTIMNDISDMLENDQTPEETAEIMEEDLGGLLWQYVRANP